MLIILIVLAMIIILILAMLINNILWFNKLLPNLIRGAMQKQLSAVFYRKTVWKIWKFHRKTSVTEACKFSEKLLSKYNWIRLHVNALLSWLAFEHFCITLVISLGLPIKLPNHDKTSLLMMASDKMVYYLKINYTKSMLFINGYYYYKFFELYLVFFGMWVKYILTKNSCKKIDIREGYSQHASHIYKQSNKGCIGNTPQNSDPAWVVHLCIVNLIG